MKSTFFLEIALLVVGMWPLGLSAAGDSPSQNITHKKGNKIRDFIQSDTRVIPLDPNIVRLATGGSSTAQVVPMTLTQTEYNVTHRQVDPIGRIATLGGSTAYYYELASADPSKPYTWGIWTYVLPYTGFKLFAQGRENYLAWVYGSGVEIAEVSKPGKKQAELDAYLDPSTRHKDIQRVDVGRLVGQEPFASTHALFLDIRIQSVYKDKQGRLTLTVKGSQSDTLYAFVHEHEGWRKG